MVFAVNREEIIFLTPVVCASVSPELEARSKTTCPISRARYTKMMFSLINVLAYYLLNKTF